MIKKYWKPAAVVLGIILVVDVCWYAMAGETTNPDQVISRWTEAYNAKDAETLTRLYNKNAVFIDVSRKHEARGIEQVSAMLAQLCQLHTAMKVTEKKRIVAGNKAVLEVEYSGTLPAAVVGKTEDCRYNLSAVLLFDLENGKIVKQTDYLDYAAYLEQFGPPKPKS